MDIISAAPRTKGYWSELLGAATYTIQGRYRTRIIEAGNGAPLLLLHGTGGHCENYVRNIMPLSKYFRVVALDFLWHGASETAGFEPSIIPKLVDQVLDVADTLGIDRFNLEGQSLGGWVAMRTALDHPERLNKLILTTVQGYQPDSGTIPGYSEGDASRTKKQSLEILADPSPENIRRRLARILFRPELLPDEAVEVRHQFYNDPNVNSVQRQLVSVYPDGPEIAKYVVTDKLASRIEAPTLVYWGDNNPAPPPVGRRLAEMIPNARFISAPETGHWAQFESYELHNREVISFLSD